jgi:hypothetical protein
MIHFNLLYEECQKIKMRFLKKPRNLRGIVFGIPACGRQVRNQRARISFSELSKFVIFARPLMKEL